MKKIFLLFMVLFIIASILCLPFVSCRDADGDDDDNNDDVSGDDDDDNDDDNNDDDIVFAISNIVNMDIYGSITLPSDEQGRYSLPPLIVNNSYQVYLQTEGDNGTVTWDLLSGGLPEGLLLENTGEIHGTVSAPGTTCFVIRAESAGETVSRGFCIKAAEDLPNTLLPEDVALTFTFLGYPLSDPNTGNPYIFSMGGGDLDPYTITHIGGSIPEGFAFNYSSDESGSYAELDGTAGESGFFSITIRGEDTFYTFYGDSSGTHVIDREYTFTVYECWRDEQCNQDGKTNGVCTDYFCDYPDVWVIAQAVTPMNENYIMQFNHVEETLILPKALDGHSYSAAPKAVDGSGIYNWTLEGSLPSGLTLSTDGNISGIPVLSNPGVTENYCFDLTVSSGGSSMTQAYCIEVVPAPVNQMLPEAAALPDAVIGASYMDRATGEGPVIDFGFGYGYPYSLEIISGSLPNGLSLDTVPWTTDVTRVQITGTPTQTGTFYITLRGEDFFYQTFGTDDPAVNNVIEREYSITVNPY